MVYVVSVTFTCSAIHCDLTFMYDTGFVPTKYPWTYDLLLSACQCLLSSYRPRSRIIKNKRVHPASYSLFCTRSTYHQMAPFVLIFSKFPRGACPCMGRPPLARATSSSQGSCTCCPLLPTTVPPLMFFWIRHWTPPSCTECSGKMMIKPPFWQSVTNKYMQVWENICLTKEV